MSLAKGIFHTDVSHRVMAHVETWGRSQAEINALNRKDRMGLIEYAVIEGL